MRNTLLFVDPIFAKISMVVSFAINKVVSFA